MTLTNRQNLCDKIGNLFLFVNDVLKNKTSQFIKKTFLIKNTKNPL